MKAALFVFAATTILSTAAAQAEERPAFYFGFHGELSWVQDTDLQIAGATVGDLEMDVEYAVGAALGYRPPVGAGFLANTRYEIELMYRETDFNRLSNSTIAPGGFGGSVESYVAMANAYYDFDTGTRWTPYIGAGLGAAQHQFDSITINVDDDDTVFAYQGMAGVAYTLEPYSYTHIGLGYRYFGTADPEFTTAGGASVEHSYDGHNLEAFLRVPF